MNRFKGAQFRTRKKSFLLLEILISVMLITLCLSPIIESLISARRADQKALEELQFGKISENAFCEIKMILYGNPYPWEQLKKECSGELSGVYSVQLSPKRERTYRCRYVLTQLDKIHKTSFHKDAIALNVKLIFSSEGVENKIFSRSLYLEKQI